MAIISILIPILIGLLSTAIGFTNRKSIKISSLLLTIVLSLVLLVTNISSLVFAPLPAYGLNPGDPWCTDNSRNSSLVQHFSDAPGWKSVNINNNHYLSSIPRDNSYYQIAVPCSPPNSYEYVNYALEVKARIKDNNKEKGEFGMVIHWNENEGNGYAAGISYPSGVFVSVDGSDDPPTYDSSNPHNDLVTYTLQFKNNLVTFYTDNTPYPIPGGISVSKFTAPGQIVLWVQGGMKVDISSVIVKAV